MDLRPRPSEYFAPYVSTAITCFFFAYLKTYCALWHISPTSVKVDVGLQAHSTIMPPVIALSLCIVFIAVLFVTDFRRKNQVSLAIWLPTIWMMYCGSRPLAYWFNPEFVSAAHIDYTEGSAVDRVFLSVLIIVGLSILYKRRLNWTGILNNNLWIFVFFAYMALSVLWSDYPAVSFKRWARTSGDLIMVLLVLTETNPLDAIKTIFRRSAFVLLPLSLILIKYFRDIGVGYTVDGLQTMWVGVTTQKNDLGAMAMVCGFYFVNNIVITRKSRRVFVDVVFLILTLWLLAGSSTASSKTSWVCFALGICVLMLFHLSARDPKKIISKYRVVIALILLIFSITYVSFEGSLFESAVSALGRDSTLTGRTDIWKAVLAVGPRDPLFGRGYGSFWIGDTAYEVWTKDKIYEHFHAAHNGYIDIYIELGAFGITLLACLIWSVHRNARQTLLDNFEYGTFRMVFLSVILIHNLTETSFARPTQLLWFIFLLICMNIPSVSLPPNHERPHRGYGTQDDQRSRLEPSSRFYNSTDFHDK